MPNRFLMTSLLALSSACASNIESGSPVESDAFADRVVSFEPGDHAGFGQDALPEIVLGPPEGSGAGAGSLDVLSLGRGGVIVLEFADMALKDGPGVDLLVFENAFTGWIELGRVAVSEDGKEWHEWPCDATDEDEEYLGCAGRNPVFSNTDNDVLATDPQLAGGDAYDLADLGIQSARFVRITDTGNNVYVGDSGGFDLDAVAVVHAPSP